jgi:8-oxo-dGTP pyrophosphatase MutT (NUDIX family)
MASVGTGSYVVVFMPVGGSKASYITLVLKREPRTDKIWFPTSSILPNEEHVDATIRELFEESGLTLTVNDLTLLSINYVRVPLLAEKHELVYVFAAYVPVPYVTDNLRTLAKVEQAVIAQSTNHHDSTYVIPCTIDIDGLFSYAFKDSVT